MDSVREAQAGDRLGRGIRWSLTAHGAVAIAVLLKSLVFPGNPVMIAPALRVDLVGLPDLLKKDLAKVPKTPPKADLEKQLKEAAEKAKSIRPEAVKPDEMVLKPKKVEKADEESKKAEEKEKKIDNALAKIRALERLKDKTEEKPTEDDDPIVIKGNQISKGTSLSGDAKERSEAGYYDLVRDALVEFWALPPWLARQNYSAQVQMRIDPAGRVLSTKFLKPSGNDQFDQAILGTIRDAQPLPRPPKELVGSLSDDGVIVGFPL
jgi:TonB family protein